MENKEKFTYVDSANIEREIEISDDDFKFVQKDSSIHDLKFDTKPTTFFKDAMRRFVKNKSSVVGGIILGIIILGSIILPEAIPYDTKEAHPYEFQMPAKLFNAGTGWWDGTKEYDDIIYSQYKEAPIGFEKNVDSIQIKEIYEKVVDTVNEEAYGGRVNFWTKEATSTVFIQSYQYGYNLNSYNYELSYDVYDYEGVSDFYSFSPYIVEFKYEEAGENKVVELVPQSTATGTGFKVDLRSVMAEKGITTKNFNKGKFAFRLNTDKDNSGIILENMIITKKDKNGNAVEDSDLEKISCKDANAMLLSTPNKPFHDSYAWSCSGQKNLIGAKMYYCSFLFDVYEDTYGEKVKQLGLSDVNSYIEKGWIKYTQGDPSSFVLLDDQCPLRSVNREVNKAGAIYIEGVISQYRELGYKRMPRFLFGTDELGKDLLKLTFRGLRTSLLLGLVTFLICFSFGLVWGSISGYFGGSVDIVMERFVEILSGIPTTILLTLFILNWGSNFGIFLLAMCMTGWIGVSGRTRTQFYRFKGREYILASRTLGSSDFRLIFKHILPNAMGTIITSSVLMIPSIIFSEASIAYLGLGLQNLDSLGVILSNNQKFISTNPTLILFPSVIMALMMVSFNLFGNGLRDAFNPSLKGAE